MALPIRRSLPSFSEITSPSAGLPNTFSTSPEKTQSCPCKIRALGLTTMPPIKSNESGKQESRNFFGFSCVPAFLIVHDAFAQSRSAWDSQTPLRQSPRSLRSRRHPSLRRHRSSLRLRRHLARSDSRQRRRAESNLRLLVSPTRF